MMIMTDLNAQHMYRKVNTTQSKKTKKNCFMNLLHKAILKYLYLIKK